MIRIVHMTKHLEWNQGNDKFNFGLVFKVLVGMMVDISNIWLERYFWNLDERLKQKKHFSLAPR